MEDITPRAGVLRKAIADRRVSAAGSGLLTVSEACEYLRVSKWTLYRLIQSGKLKTVKIGSRRLIRKRAVIDMVEQLEAVTEV